MKVPQELINRIKEAFPDRDGLYEFLDTGNPKAVVPLIQLSRMQMKPSEIAHALRIMKFQSVIADADGAVQRDLLAMEFMTTYAKLLDK